MWFCGPLDALPCWALGLVFFGASVVTSLCFPGSVALLFVFGWAPLVLSCCLPCWARLVSLSVVALPSPAVALVQFFAGTSLWVSGCSCDGLVALL